MAPLLMRSYRDRYSIPGHLWENFAKFYRDSALVEGVYGAEWSNPTALIDGNLATIARAKKDYGTENSLVIKLNREEQNLSDVVIIMADEHIAQDIQVAVSSDGAVWEEPFRVERWYDTIWVWDLHQRPWTQLRLSGFNSYLEIDVREVFAFFSQRHSR